MSRFISDKRKVVCLIIIVCIVFLSLLGILFVGRTTAGHTACIYSNGRLIKTVELDSESEQTFTVYSDDGGYKVIKVSGGAIKAVSYKKLRAHETDSHLVCRLLLEKKKTPKPDRAIFE